MQANFNAKNQIKKITDLQRLKLETYRLFQKLAAEEKCSKMDLINNYKAVIAV